ncbi:MAG: DUF58 domain-containing protein [Myxococcota bacterium]
MRLIPGRSLILALVAPLILALVTLLEPSVLRLVILADGIIALLAIIDVLFVLRPAISVKRRLPETASLARPLHVELEIKNHSRRRLDVLVNDALFAESRSEGLPAALSVDPGVVRRGEYKLWAMARGVRTIGAHFVRYRSPAGFWIRQLELPASDTIRVYPDVQAVRHYELLARQNRDAWASRLTRLRGGDTEFERLRDYLPDDDFRRIDWKATARRRKLTTREYQLEKNQNVVFLLDCGRLMTARWDGFTALDYALNSTLMLSHVAIRRGDLVGLIAFDEKVTRLVKPAGGISASNRIIQSTFDLFPSMVEADYEGAFKTLRMQVQRRTLVVFITHAIDDPTARRIQRLTRELLPQHLPLCVLLKDREVESRITRRATNDEEIATQAAAAEVVVWRDRIVSEMQRAGVLMLDVFADQLTGALVSRYLDTKARGLI